MPTDGFLRLREQAAAQTARRIDPARPVWIFGAGHFGQAVARVLQARGGAVAGFVETAPRTREIQGLLVVDWPTLAQTDSNAQLALGIFNRAMPHDELVALAVQAGFAPPLMPWEIYDEFADALGWRFWLGERRLLAANLDRLCLVAERLADVESRQTLLRLCAFRLGLDLEYASFRSTDLQYFNALTLPPLQGKAMTCIDCGAYDGDTFAELLRQPGIHCRQAFLLEPDPDNYAKLVRRMAGQHPQAVCLPLAAADQYGILSFASGQGEGSAIGEGGNIRIAAAALDQIVPQGQVDFIKLDVEGAEASVLRGAQRMIERCRPVLAVSLYHNPSDIWELPELLFSLCRNYSFHVRQHCCNSFESVLYAIPDFE